jgi:hypothetical protein
MVFLSPDACPSLQLCMQLSSLSGYVMLHRRFALQMALVNLIGLFGEM